MSVNIKSNMLDMFLDSSVGESYSQGRLTTQTTDSGSAALIAYGWLKLAEYSESRDAVTVFTGHKSLRSRTIARYLNDVVQRANTRDRDVILSGESPTVATPNDGTRFINNYVSFDSEWSAVEADAVEAVSESLAHL